MDGGNVTEEGHIKKYIFIQLTKSHDTLATYLNEKIQSY